MVDPFGSEGEVVGGEDEAAGCAEGVAGGVVEFYGGSLAVGAGLGG